jgi:hypothetical protein
MLEETGCKFGIPTLTISLSTVKEANSGPRDQFEYTLHTSAAEVGVQSLKNFSSASRNLYFREGSQSCIISDISDVILTTI